MIKSSDSSVTTPWHQLDAELNHWVANEQQATLWWRDDDAVAPGPKLDQLTNLTRTTGLLLAVIPANAEPGLAPVLSEFALLSVAQHGYAHINHAPRGQGLGAWELGIHRGEEAVVKELLVGRERLHTLFGTQFLPVVVPPWNRIAPEVVQGLIDVGYAGVSAFGAQEVPLENEGFVVANSHCDPISWKGGTVFAGEQKTLNQLVIHLAARRTGGASEQEHTGFLTHHIDLDANGWQFCEQLAKFVDNHAGARWIAPVEVFRWTP